MCPSRERDRERLDQELQTDEYQMLLKNLGRRSLFFRQFATWVGVTAFMRSGTTKDLRKDEVLRPILTAHAEDEDPRWRTILLAIFQKSFPAVLPAACSTYGAGTFSSRRTQTERRSTSATWAR